MQLKRFDAFVRHLSGDVELQQLGTLHGVYNRFGDQWRDANQILIGDSIHQHALERTLTRNHHWRAPKSLRAFFPVRTFQAVVAIETATPSRAETRNKLEQIIANALKHSSDEFDAQHDALTGLPNSRLIERSVSDVTSGMPSDSSAEGLNIAPTVALLALDIDHFKQVNDSYGHDYGDLVLRIFGHRLEEAASKLGSQYSDIKLVPGRLSGEEFVVLVSGTLSASAVTDIAERIRSEIANTPLPSDEEWAGIPPESRGKTLVLPHISERKITASVGVSAILTASGRRTPAILDLRREADAALYRAKAGGRNTVRSFPEIRDKYGSVLEHHADTGVVVIDIGSQVNVRRGNEFLIFHPDFTGNKPFIFTDGRTQKRLGTYPKISCGRIVVFDVQPEISFARVEEADSSKIPSGAATEYIPVGSITHLLRKSPAVAMDAGVDIASVEQLDAFIKRNAAAHDLCVVVFTLDEVENLERSRGVVFVNKALAGLFEAIQQSLPRDAVIAQIQSNALAAGFLHADDTVDLAQQVVENARSRAGGAACFAAGIFSSAPISPTPGDETALNPAKALDLARYAALPAARTAGELVAVFSPDVANNILFAQRQAQRFTELRADYKSFIDAGVVNATLETHAALAELMAGDFDAALALANRACELDPNDDILLANKAVTEFAVGHPFEAHKIFETIASRNHQFEPPYLATRALAAFQQYQAAPDSISREAVKALLAKAKAEGAYLVYLGIKTSDVEAAILTLETGAPEKSEARVDGGSTTAIALRQDPASPPPLAT